MPRVNIYIRNDDWEAWNNIPNKPEWIHEGLTKGLVMIPARSIKISPAKMDAILNEEMAKPTPFNHEPNPYVCKKCGMMKVAGKCMTKGCKG